jgi:hypothetical protein
MYDVPMRELMNLKSKYVYSIDKYHYADKKLKEQNSNP